MTDVGVYYILMIHIPGVQKKPHLYTLPHCPGRGPIFHRGAPRGHWGATPVTGVYFADLETTPPPHIPETEQQFTWGNPGKLGETRGNPGKPGETQGNLGKLGETRENLGKLGES